jgi:hypothetical protein
VNDRMTGVLMFGAAAAVAWLYLSGRLDPLIAQLVSRGEHPTHSEPSGAVHAGSGGSALTP